MLGFTWMNAVPFLRVPSQTPEAGERVVLSIVFHHHSQAGSYFRRESEGTLWRRKEHINPVVRGFVGAPWICWRTTVDIAARILRRRQIAHREGRSEIRCVPRILDRMVA